MYSTSTRNDLSSVKRSPFQDVPHRDHHLHHLPTYYVHKDLPLLHGFALKSLQSPRTRKCRKHSPQNQGRQTLVRTVLYSRPHCFFTNAEASSCPACFDAPAVRLFRDVEEAMYRRTLVQQNLTSPRMFVELREWRIVQGAMLLLPRFADYFGGKEIQKDGEVIHR